MKQKDFVVKAMIENGGYATLQYLNQKVDFSTWGTKTPFATIRRIVQTYDDFFKIQPGLWGLTEFKDSIFSKFHINTKNSASVSVFTHSYFQGIITEIGNIRNYDTYIPPQDKNKYFLEKKLSEIVSVDKIFEFTYPEILRRARTVDVVWFNERKLPTAFYEIEHSTDIKNSLNKFYELQDFRANFFIVAAPERENQFKDIINTTIYAKIKNLVKFVNYDDLVKQYELESRLITRVI